MTRVLSNIFKVIKIFYMLNDVYIFNFISSLHLEFITNYVKLLKYIYKQTTIFFFKLAFNSVESLLDMVL